MNFPFELRKKLVYTQWYPFGLIIPVPALIAADMQLIMIGWSELVIDATNIINSSQNLIYIVDKL
jgi:hypothetical protein